MKDGKFRTAKETDRGDVYSLYKTAIGSEGCVWNELYPSMNEINEDLAANSLFVLESEGNIIGAISVVPENELDGMDCWQFENAAEIARVVVHSAYRGKNLAAFMVSETEKRLLADGCRAIHLSVAKKNTAAYKTYINKGFKTVGEAKLYCGDYYLMEKELLTQTERIEKMEAVYDKCREAVDKLLTAAEDYAAIKPQLDELARYYESPLWLEDFDADRNGKIPNTIKRGILTEDAIWDLLTDEDRAMKTLIQ